MNSLIAVAHAIAASAPLQLVFIRHWGLQAGGALGDGDARDLEFLRGKERPFKSEHTDVF